MLRQKQRRSPSSINAIKTTTEYCWNIIASPKQRRDEETRTVTATATVALLSLLTPVEHADLKGRAANRSNGSCSVPIKYKWK